MRPIQVGDIVVLQNDGTSRYHWKLAKVNETINGRDGAVRDAKFHLMNKDKVITLRCPIQHLIPLEANLLTLLTDLGYIVVVVVFYIDYRVINPRECYKDFFVYYSIQ